jgi:hypothetical protein
MTYTITGTIGLVCADTKVSNTALVWAEDGCGALLNDTSVSVGFEIPLPELSIAVVKEQDPVSPGVQ